MKSVKSKLYQPNWLEVVDDIRPCYGSLEDSIEEKFERPNFWYTPEYNVIPTEIREWLWNH